MHWQVRQTKPLASMDDVRRVVLDNREFTPVAKLDYGDHGLEKVAATMAEAMRANKRIALYADYDVDGTMSCVSWIWFFKAAGYTNYLHHIPCRFREGYGVNLNAIRKLVEEDGAQVVITMDTGITANEEAAWCRERGVTFICTDHHVIQPDKMPDSLILNPKMNPHPLYQQLCGCGITFVLLRRLAQLYPMGAFASQADSTAVWNDLLGLTGMATICDVVPLNGVNHTLARRGVNALMASQRPVLKALREAAAVDHKGDEKDVGFRLGPRINAVGRLEHADVVIKAFIEEDPGPLVHQMGICNDRRKKIQSEIVDAARRLADQAGDDPILFLGSEDWHPGVVGIAASKIAEEYWRPTWLFQRLDGVCKGSARSIPGFDVTAAMLQVGSLFQKCGGHAAAGGFTFQAAQEQQLREALNGLATQMRTEDPVRWQSSITIDGIIDPNLACLDLVDTFDQLKPFGHGFEEPRFLLEATIDDVRFLNDRATGAPRHTAVAVATPHGIQRIMFFNDVLTELKDDCGLPKRTRGRFIVTVARNTFRGQTNLALHGVDCDLS